MSAPGLDELGARVLEIVRALASSPDTAADALKNLVPTDLDDRVKAATETAVAAAERARDSAQTAVTEATSAAAEQIANATKDLEGALARLAAQRDEALQAAEHAEAAAAAAFEQASATGRQAMTTAKETLAAAKETAERSKAEAQRVFEASEATARKALADVESNAKETLEEVKRQFEELKEAVDKSAAQVREEAERLVDAATAAAERLPADLVGLGDDALAKLDEQLSWPSGLLSLVAKLLSWLKRQFFADVDALQVVWQPGAPGPLGIGLLWQDGAQSLRMIFRPRTADAGDVFVISSAGADTHTIPGKGASLSITAKSGQEIVIGTGAPPIDLGPGGLSLAVAFDAVAFDESLGPVRALVGPPTISAALHHAGSWSYEATVTFPRYGGEFSASELFARAGIPIPIEIPTLKEYRSLTIGVADGRTVVREGAAP